MRHIKTVTLLFIALCASVAAKSEKYQLETVTDGLNHPWSLAFLPDGDYLVSFLGGELRRISSSGEIGPALSNVPAAYVKSQGGFFDVALDRYFAQNQRLYLAFAHGTPKDNATRVISAHLDGDKLVNLKIIFTVKNSKDTAVHYGGKLLPLPDGTLLLTTGDGFDLREAAQDPFSQLGKIIRFNADGTVPDNNPFADGEEADPYVYTLGHRNPQGLAYDRASRIIYLHEHGPKGGDEVNLISAGANYGWPATSHGINYSGAKVSPFTSLEGITAPLKVWLPSIAPAGLAFYNGDAFPEWQGDLFVGALVNKEVRRLHLAGGEVVEEETLFAEVGQRVRDVRVGPDGFLYLLTETKGDVNGKLIRVVPKR